ncbi:MAG: hypothetical protein QOG85_215 [Gaiellaceae bacterium]|jgi:integrase|nr:hypothetical protein [Gaiellaceae bacterium]
MPRETLTDVKVRRLGPAAAGKRYDVWDALVPGLSLRVTDHGQKSWTVVGRLHGKPLRATLGPFPALGVAAARAKARSAIETLASGRHPKRLRADMPTVGDAIDAWMKTTTWVKSSRQNVESAVRKYIKPALGEMLVSDVTRRDLIDLLDRVSASFPQRANAVLAYLSGFFRYALERELVDANPCSAIRAPGAKVARDRVYTDPELRAIWKAAVAIDWPYGQLARLLLVTAQRRGQARYMLWAEIDAERALWTSPTKEKRLHPVPLSDLAREILAEAKDLGPLVFTTDGKHALNNFWFVLKEIRKAEGVPADFRLHDLRRTAATRMAELGVEPHIIDAVLDHVAGGVSGIYNRYRYVEEMRQALALWANRLREILAAG